MQLNGFFRWKARLWREGRRTKICHVEAEHGNKSSVQNMFKQNPESKKKRTKQNLGMPEDNLKSIVQAIFLLTREMLCQRFD